EFVAGEPRETARLLHAALQWPHLAGTLAPHFTPNCGGAAAFTRLYASVVEAAVAQGSDMAFMMLTKFDLQWWFSESNPTLSDRTVFLDSIVQAMYYTSQQSDADVMMGIYRQHLLQLLTHRFPDLYGATLHALLEGAVNHCIDIETWNAFLRTMGCDPISGDSSDAPCQLSLTQSKSTLSSPKIPEHFLKTYHSQLIQLRWDLFLPSAQDFETMLKVRETHPPASTCFLGQIAVRLPWQRIMELADERLLEPEEAGRLQRAVLCLLVQLGCDSQLAESTCDLAPLLQQAAGFSWHHLDAESFTEAAQWYRTNGDPSCLIADTKDRSAGLLRLLKEAAGLGRECASSSGGEALSKHCSYLRCFVHMLCGLAQTPGSDLERIQTVFTALLAETEAIAITGAAPGTDARYAIATWSEILGALNACGCPRAAASLAAALHRWLTESRSVRQLCAVVTASANVVDVRQMAALCEACTDSYFQADRATSAGAGWTNIVRALSVPELTRADFIRVCVQECYLLTLYGHALQCLVGAGTVAQRGVVLDCVLHWFKTADPRFRFLCRVMATFLSAQMPQSSCLRLEPHAPGHLQEGATGPPATEATQQLFAQLGAIERNRAYAGYRGDAAEMCEFVADPAHSLRDVRRLLRLLVEKLFPNVAYLHVLSAT
ncbi:PREDICTED: ectopic P granules protein 5 homolog, partial [Priapulus caudatus]|uniref:Ectopic P granules protein 5 homolog n=1 Tax=Priapulus caudatus TaxID=37621 RepID=A0ABM1F1B6_PRICU